MTKQVVFSKYTGNYLELSVDSAIEPADTSSSQQAPDNVSDGWDVT